MKNIFALFLYTFLLIAILSCSQDDEGATFGKVEIEFDNVVGTADLQLDTDNEPYTNSTGEPYKVSALRYYISRIKLKRSDGTVYEDEVSADGSKGYYLIDESEAASQVVELENVPVGDYTEMTFTIGVDANQVAEGAQTGVLDVTKGMFWDWNSGYIFVMLEGISSVSSDKDKYILYHVGGYKSDPANNLRTKTVAMGSETAQVSSTATPEIHMIVDVNKFFQSPNEISFVETPVQHLPAANAKVADNYMSTFIVDHVHN